MGGEIGLKDFWNSAPSGREVFHPDRVSLLPESARRYLTHAIAPGATSASCYGSSSE